MDVLPDIQPGDWVVIIDRLDDFFGLFGTVEGTIYPGPLTGQPTVDVKLVGLDLFPPEKYGVDQVRAVRKQVAA
jgi:hypothetical protein